MSFSLKQILTCCAIVVNFTVIAQQVEAIDRKGSVVTIKNNTVTTAATAPTDPIENDVWFDTSDSNTTRPRIWNGATWVSLDYTGTPGSIFYTGADSNPTQDNSNLFWNTTTSRLGIGTNTPNARLDVAGGTIRFSDYGAGTITGTTTNILAVDADGDLIEVDPSSLATNNNIYNTNGTLTANRALNQGNFDLNFDANTLVVSGNDNRVGIGTTNPSSELDVIGNIEATNNANNTSILLRPNSFSGSTISDIRVGGSNANAQNLAFKFGGDAEFMRISSVTGPGAGRLGILTGAPTKTLDVNGEVRIRTLPAGATSDDLVTTDTNGNLRKSPITDLETKTSIAQNTTTGVVTHNSEDGTSQSVNVISGNANNSISTGTDGGAYFNNPIKAYGILTPATNSITAIGISAVVKNGNGRYTFTMAAARSSANYPIQLSVFEAGTDNINIYVTAQTATTFSISIIREVGGTFPSDSYVDRTCYFTVLDF